MEAVIKIGGSLAENPPLLKELCNRLSSFSKKHNLVIVPGGGKFADVVRDYDQEYALSAVAAHEMAILGMDQFGLMLSEIIPKSRTTYSIEEAERFSKSRQLTVFLPARIMFRKKPLEPSWDVTSDSIAAYIAGQLKAKNLILVTDVDGVFTADPKKNSKAEFISSISTSRLLAFGQRTSVDKFLPKLLLETHTSCTVVNGAYPERVDDVLVGRKTVATYIEI